MESRADAKAQLLPVVLEEEQDSASSSTAFSSSDCQDNEDTAKVDVEVIVKHTFIEVVDPTLSRRTRSMSDSCVSRPWTTWQSWEQIVSEKQNDLSDASTEDLDACTRDPSVRDENTMSDDDGVVDAPMIEMASYQSVEQWWSPVSFESPTVMSSSTQLDASAEPFVLSSHRLDASAEPFVPAWMQPSTDTPTSNDRNDRLCWADQVDEPDTTIQEWWVDSSTEEWRTTVMLRNMPNNYTRDMLIELVEEMGFGDAYDFVYLPIDFSSQAGLGYAFINFNSVEKAQLCFHTFEGFSAWKVPSDKMCTVTWSDPYQGLESHIERYRNSPVMHQSIEDEWKPALFSNGKRVTFPPPTKTIKTPKIRQPKKN